MLKIHVGRKLDKYPTLVVHDEVMKDSAQEKYWGEVIHENCKQHVIIVD